MRVFVLTGGKWDGTAEAMAELRNAGALVISFEDVVNGAVRRFRWWWNAPVDILHEKYGKDCGARALVDRMEGNPMDMVFICNLLRNRFVFEVIRRSIFRRITVMEHPFFYETGELVPFFRGLVTVVGQGTQIARLMREDPRLTFEAAGAFLAAAGIPSSIKRKMACATLMADSAEALAGEARAFVAVNRLGVWVPALWALLCLMTVGIGVFGLWRVVAGRVRWLLWDADAEDIVVNRSVSLSVNRSEEAIGFGAGSDSEVEFWRATMRWYQERSGRGFGYL